MRVVPPVSISAPPPVARRRVVFVGSGAPFDDPVGVVDNGKSMAAELMVAAVGGLGALTGRSSTHVLQKKPSAGRVMTLERRAELLARARLVISGVGD